MGSLTTGCYGKKEIEILSPVAEILSLAVENSNLYQESQRREEIQKLLKEVSQDVTTLDIDSLLKKLTEKARELLKADVADVRVREKEMWPLLGISGIDPERTQSKSTGIARGRSKWIIQNRKPLLIPDISISTGLPTGESIRLAGVRGYLGVPLFSRSGEVVGVLRVLTYQPREFNQEEVDLLQQLANGAAIAIENARLFEEVRKKSQELEEAFQEKSDFLNTMAHEIRTPLNVVMATYELAVDGFYGELDEKQTKGIEPIWRNANNLLNLVNDILDLARLEPKRVPLHIEEFPLKEMIDDLESSFTPLTEGKGLDLKFNLDDTALRLKSDKSKVKGILQNLLANAVKYTDRGEVEVRVCSLRDGKPEGERISIMVRDTGIGMKEADMSHLFEVFYMVGGVDRRKYPGSGLGLCIVKRLVDLLEGDIHVESEWGKGSTFTVILPSVHPTES